MTGILEPLLFLKFTSSPREWCNPNLGGTLPVISSSPVPGWMEALCSKLETGITWTPIIVTINFKTKWPGEQTLSLSGYDREWRKTHPSHQVVPHQNLRINFGRSKTPLSTLSKLWALSPSNAHTLTILLISGTQKPLKFNADSKL